MGVKLVGGKKINDYIKALENTELQGRKIIGKVVWSGAKVVADSMKAGIESLPVGNTTGTVTQYEKEGLEESFGITKLADDNGVLNVKLGFDGYNNHITEKYPKGHPNVMVARAIVSGTSFRQKNDFVKRAVNKSRKQALNSMVQTCDELHEKTMNGGKI